METVYSNEMYVLGKECSVVWLETSKDGRTTEARRRAARALETNPLKAFFSQFPAL